MHSESTFLKRQLPGQPCVWALVINLQNGFYKKQGRARTIRGHRTIEVSMRRHSLLPAAAFFKTHLANTYSFGSPTDFSSMLVVNNLWCRTDKNWWKLLLWRITGQRPPLWGVRLASQSVLQLHLPSGPWFFPKLLKSNSTHLAAHNIWNTAYSFRFLSLAGEKDFPMTINNE